MCHVVFVRIKFSILVASFIPSVRIYTKLTEISHTYDNLMEAVPTAIQLTYRILIRIVLYFSVFPMTTDVKKILNKTDLY